MVLRGRRRIEEELGTAQETEIRPGRDMVDARKPKSSSRAQESASDVEPPRGGDVRKIAQTKDFKSSAQWLTTNGTVKKEGVALVATACFQVDVGGLEL